MFFILLDLIANYLLLFSHCDQNCYRILPIFVDKFFGKYITLFVIGNSLLKCKKTKQNDY